MKKPLVEPIPETDPSIQEMVLFYNETLGFCPNSIKTMQHRPRIASAFIEMNQAVMENKGRVTSALKRLIAYVSSHATGCQYCQAHGIRAAERYGAAKEQLENIWEFRTHPGFNEAERAALELSIAASNIPNAVTDEISTEMNKHWNPGEIVEIMGVIALFGYLNRWNDSMATTIEQGAIDSGMELLSSKSNWNGGKHRREESA